MSKPLRVLIVDQSDDTVEILVRELERASFAIEYMRVSSVSTMRDSLLAQPWDLLVCDYDASAEFSGPGVLTALKTDSTDIPVIVWTNAIGEEAAAAAIHMGAKELVLKGNNARLVAAVERQVAGRLRPRDSGLLGTSSVELEQRVAERTKALESAMRRTAAILNNTSDAIIVADNQGRIQETNPAFRELFGYFRKPMIGFGVSQMFEDEDGILLQEALKAAVTFGKSDNIEVTGVRADGTRFEADIAVASILEKGILENIIYSVRDVTRRKLVEKELRVMLDQQRELNELKSRFVSMTSHEFRTPLAIIRTTTDILGSYRHRMDNGQIDQRLDKIRAQITHMTVLMDDVLTLARDQAGRSAFSAEASDLDEFCKEIVEQFVSDPDTEHKFDYSCDSRPLVIIFDHTLMRKAINNLVTNAIKYSPKGSTVFVSITRANDTVQMHVRDEGVGIPESDQPRLFEAFHRGSNVGTISGTGLGLTITKQSIEAHGGSLSFESKLNVGTTFHATIPIHVDIKETS